MISIRFSPLAKINVLYLCIYVNNFIFLKFKKISKIMTQMITHTELSYNFLKLPEQMNASFELKAFICLNRYHKNFDTFMKSEFTCRNKFMLKVNGPDESFFLFKFNKNSISKFLLYRVITYSCFYHLILK